MDFFLTRFFFNSTFLGLFKASFLYLAVDLIYSFLLLFWQ